MLRQDSSGASAAIPSSGGKRLVKSKSGLKIICQHDRENAPWDMAEPLWIPDREVYNCVSCNVRFDLFKRRHHCRRCGMIFCNKCCGSKVQFHRMGFVDPVRLCKPCSDVTRKEEEFFNEDLKLLLSGAPFNVSTSRSRRPLEYQDPVRYGRVQAPSPPVWEAADLLFCKLSADQKHVLFEWHESSEPYEPLAIEDVEVPSEKNVGKLIAPIELGKVTEIETHNGDKLGPESVTLRIQLRGDGGMMLVQFKCPPEPSKKPSLRWNAALVKGMEMVLESRKQMNLEEMN